MSSSKIIRVRAVISGRVQGVGFRYFAVDIAHSFHVRGWVRNVYSGEVEAMMEGEETDVQNMIRQLKTGPRLSHVTRVELHDEVPVPGEFDSFDVTY